MATIVLGNKRILVEQSEFKGRQQFQVMNLWDPKRDGNWVRRDGVTVALEDAPKLIEAMLNVLKGVSEPVIEGAQNDHTSK